MGLHTKSSSLDGCFEMGVGLIDKIMSIHWSVILHCYAAAGTHSFPLQKSSFLPRRRMCLSQYLEQHVRFYSAYAILRHRDLRIMKHPKMLCRFICIWSSIFSGARKHRDFDNRDVSVCTEERFVIHAIPCGVLVNSKCFSRVEKRHVSRPRFGPPLISSFKSTLVHSNSLSSYEFFSLIQLLHNNVRVQRRTRPILH